MAAAMIVGATGVAFAAFNQTRTYVLTPTSNDFPNAGGRFTITIFGPYFYSNKPWRDKFYNETVTAEFWGLAPNGTGYITYVDSNPVPFGTWYTDEWGDLYLNSGREVASKPSFPAAIYVTDMATGNLVLASSSR